MICRKRRRKGRIGEEQGSRKRWLRIRRRIDEGRVHGERRGEEERKKRSNR
jgi:hypothetical protein